MSRACKHCKDRIANRRRGLCSHCYYKPEVRALFPSSRTPLTPDRECANCHKRLANKPRGLCGKCYYDKCVRVTFDAGVWDEEEPTQEQVDRMVAEQSKKLPDWWEEATERQRDLEGPSKPYTIPMIRIVSRQNGKLLSTRLEAPVSCTSFT